MPDRHDLPSAHNWMVWAGHYAYTNMKWGHAQNYHLALDSGVLGIDKCMDIITELY